MHGTDNLVLAADNLLQGIASFDGATVDVFTGAAVELAAGYVVSIDGYGWKWGALNPNLAEVVQQYVNHAPAWIDELGAANPVYVGAWTDHGTLHLDLSAVFTGLQFALQIAREQRQIAIWDCAAGREVRVPAAVSLRKTYRHHSDVRNPLSTYNRGSVTLRKAGE